MPISQLADGRNLLAELESDPGKVSLETLLQAVLEGPQFHGLVGETEGRALTPLSWSNVCPTAGSN